MDSSLSPCDPAPDIKVLLGQGIRAARRGELDDARACFQAVLDRDASQEEAWLWLAAVAEDPEQSIACLERALAINPRSLRARAGLQWARKRFPSGEVPDEAPWQPAWGGLVDLAPPEVETRRRWRYMIGLVGTLLLGGLLWWGFPRVLQLVDPHQPQVTLMEMPPPATSLPIGAPSPPTRRAVPRTMPPTREAALPAETSSPPPSTTPVSATSTAIYPIAPPPPALTATPVVIITGSPSPMPTPGTVWPTPGPTTTPLTTPEPTPLPLHPG